MWIKTKAKFRHDIPDVEWDMYSDSQKRDACEPRKFRFNSDDILYYNECSDGGSTIHFTTYDDSISIEMSVEELDKIIFNGKDNTTSN